MTRDHHFRDLLRALALGAALGFAPPAAAQLVGGGLPSLPGGGLPGGLPGSLPGQVRARDLSDATATLRRTNVAPPVEALAGELGHAPLDQVRRLTAEQLLRRHSDLVEADDRGQPVVRGEVLAVAPDPTALARLRQAGFSVRSQEDLGALGLKTYVLGLPKGRSTVEAVRQLRALDPVGQYDFNHLYQEAGSVGGAAVSAVASAATPDARGLRIGLVDGSVAASRPALARAEIVQRAFAPGGAAFSAHATAVASLIVGGAGPFHGAANGASLYVADVYGPTAAGGSAQAVARGLAWLAEQKTPVINISLVGPPNLLLGAAVRALIARGHLVVAAVGNDGPAAAPLYPAAYPGVVAVTGVDTARRVLPEAGRGTHIDFAAPGADMAAAGLGGGFVSVRGTSFAAPIVAGRLARLAATATAVQAVEALGREAVDLGAPGPDPIYGRGLVGAELRADPAAMGVRQEKSPAAG
jgi:hypothetical protein